MHCTIGNFTISSSFMTTTWVVESMACANAINHWRRMKQLKKVPFASSPDHHLRYQNHHLQHISPPPSPSADTLLQSLCTTTNTSASTLTATCTATTSPCPQDGANDPLTSMTSILVFWAFLTAVCSFAFLWLLVVFPPLSHKCLF